MEDIPNISVNFQHLPLEYVIQIANEGDVKRLKKIIQQVLPHIHLDIDPIEYANFVQMQCL